VGSSNVIGLLFEINADPTKGDAAVEAFGKRTGQSVGAVKAQIKDYNRALVSAYDEGVQRAKAASGIIDESLLSNRESARLLSEEFGLHLPRAISGAISKVEGLQSVLAVAGTAALAIFAGREVFEGLGKLTDYVRESFAEQSEDAKSFAAAAVAAYKEMEGAAESAFTKFKTVEAGQFEIATIDARVDRLLKIINAFKTLDAEVRQGADIREVFVRDTELARTIADAAKEGIQKIEDAQEKLNEAGALQYAARQRRNELEKKDQAELTKSHEDAAREWVATEKQKAEESAKAAREASEGARKQLEVEHRLREEEIKAGREAGKVVAELAQHQNELAASAVRADAAELKFVMDLERLGVIEQKNLSFLKEYTPNMYHAAAATEHLGTARKWLAGITQDLTQVEDAFKNALQGDRAALDSMMEGAEATAEAVASMTGSTRATAYVRGTYDAAKAIECMAAYIESYGTDIPQLLASIQWAAAADQQFAVAGHGSRHGGGGGAGYGGTASARANSYGGRGVYGGGGGSGSSSDRQSTGGGGSGSGPGATVHINNYGPVVSDANSTQQLFDQWSQQVQNGALWSTSSVAAIQGPTSTGRG
jgi:chemotaxis protein histidine kinase CheA